MRRVDILFSMHDEMLAMKREHMQVCGSLSGGDEESGQVQRVEILFGGYEETLRLRVYAGWLQRSDYS